MNEVDVIIGANERNEVTFSLTKRDGARVLQQLFLDPDEADETAAELKKWAAIVRAKREGMKGAA